MVLSGLMLWDVSVVVSKGKMISSLPCQSLNWTLFYSLHSWVCSIFLHDGEMFEGLHLVSIQLWVACYSKTTLPTISNPFYILDRMAKPPLFLLLTETARALSLFCCISWNNFVCFIILFDPQFLIANVWNVDSVPSIMLWIPLCKLIQQTDFSRDLLE